MEKEHSDMINNEFNCLQKAGLKIKLSNCSFSKSKSINIGLLVSINSIQLLADKIEAPRKLKPLTDIKRS